MRVCRIGLVLVAILVSTVSVGAQDMCTNNEADSIVTFSFKMGEDIFFSDYKFNRPEMRRMEKFLQGNRAKIMRGQKKIHVFGYSASKDTYEYNVSLAKKRSNRVKSHMITIYGFREEVFKTVNYWDSVAHREVVDVCFSIPRVVPIVEALPKRESGEPIKVSDNAIMVVDSLATFPEKVEFVKGELPFDGFEFESPLSYALLTKGAFYTSLYANFTEDKTSNMLIEPLFDVANVYSRNLSVQAAFGYFVANNVAMGAYFDYSFSDLRLNVSSDILQLMINSKTYQTNNVSSGFTVGLFNKSFVPLEFTNRVFLVNETSLFYGYRRSLQRNVFSEGAMLSKVLQDTHTVGVKMSLGVQYFLTKSFTIEFIISPIAAMYQYNTVLNNETLNGKFAGGGVNTMLLPIDLKFGLSYFFGLDYNKNKEFINDYMDKGYFKKNRR